MVEKLVFGLDLGINNVGHSAVRVGEDAIEIEHLGVYAFASPLVDDNDLKAGYAAGQRGMQRRARRTLRRRGDRKRLLYYILAEHGFLPADRKMRDSLLCKNYHEDRPFNPYVLRAAALTKALTPFELGRVITHLANHRGFLSPRAQRLIGVADDLLANASDGAEETGKLLSEIKSTRTAMEQAGAPTIGAFYAERFRHNQLIRSKTKSNRKVGGKPNLNREEFKGKFLTERHVRPDRHMIRDEFDRIIAVQREFHPLLTESFIAKLRDAIFSQRPIEGNFDRRGECSFFPNEKRMYRASLAAQKFIIAQSIANLEVSDELGQTRKLARGERKSLCDVLIQGVDLEWSAVKSITGISPLAVFNREPQKKTKGKLDKLKGSATAKAMHELLGEQWEGLDYEARVELVGDLISFAATKGSSQAERRYKLLLRKTYGALRTKFSQGIVAELVTLELPKGTLNIGLKAARMLTPLMLAGMTYDEAASAKGLDHTQPRGPQQKVSRLNPALAQNILHPGVRSSVQNAFRVINAMLDKYGAPSAIHIELPRDLAKSLADQLELEKDNRGREKVRREARQRLVEQGLKPTADNVKRLLLFDECDGGKLPYEPGRIISSLDELCSAEYEIDHIVPRSHQITDAMSNFVLCSADVNRRKSGRTPYEYFVETLADEDHWARIQASVKSLKNMSFSKKQRILAVKRPEGFVGRHEAAIGYISREILSAVKSLEGSFDVIVSPGQATGMLRRRWGLGRLIELHPEEKARLDLHDEAVEKGTAFGDPPKLRSNFKHHALDALVVALTTRSNLLKITNYYKEKEDSGVRPKEGFPLPDPNLIAKVQNALRQCIVVHKPNRKLEGQIHELTARTPASDVPPGRPNSAARWGNQLVRFGSDGKPCQAYDLGNNHHVAIFEATDGSGRRVAEVRSLFQVYERRAKKLPAIEPECSRPGYQLLFALCKGDMVRMSSGELGVVSKFSAKAKWGDAEIAIWKTFSAQKCGRVNADNPYVVAYIQTASRLREITGRILMQPLG
jgi:CRISPR-associated endonuclease Csn1